MTRRRPGFSLLALAIWLILTAQVDAVQGITLGQELAKHGIVAGPTIVLGQDRLITSHEVHNGPDFLFIGFYIDNGTGYLGDEIHLGRFDKRSSAWKETVINARPLPGQARDSSPCSMMAGSITAIDRDFGNLFVKAHGNPSAGCTLIVSEDLQYRDSVYRFFLGALDDKTIIYQHSSVHFAPTHYVEASAYDISRKKNLSEYLKKDTLSRLVKGAASPADKTH